MSYDDARGSSMVSCVYMSSSVKTILPLTFLTYEKPLMFLWLFSQTMCFVVVYQHALGLALFVAMSKTPEFFFVLIFGAAFRASKVVDLVMPNYHHDGDLSSHLSIDRSIDGMISQSISRSICRTMDPSIYLSIDLSIDLSISLYDPPTPSSC